MISVSNILSKSALQKVMSSDSEKTPNNRRESFTSQISTASIFSGGQRKRSIEINVKRKLSLKVLNAKDKTLLEKKKKRKSIISIVRKKNSLNDDTFEPKERQQENGWMEELVDIFTVPVPKLHINDDKGILSKDNSIDRLINLTLIVSLVLAVVASAALAQIVFKFGFGSTRIILPNDGTQAKVFTFT